MSRWLRINEDCIDNPKILKLPEALRWQWVALLCVASKNDGVLPPLDDVALCLRVPEAKAAEFITKLVKAKLIDKDGDVFVPHNWSKRQYKTDGSDPTNAKRQKRYRDRHRNDSNGVTDNGSNDVTVKRPEAEQKTETEQSRAAAPPLNDVVKREAALRLQAEALFRGYGQQVPNLDRCGIWLGLGHQPNLIVAAIEKVLKRGKPITALDYFDGAIRDAHAKPPMPVSGMAEVVDLSRINWDATVKLWRGNQSIWPRGIGSEPGQPGCKCPANIIAAHGIDPGNGRSVSQPLVFISQGSQEMLAHCTEAQLSRWPTPKVFEFEEDGVVRTGAFVFQAFPDNWDSATGERIPPANSEVSAA